MSRQSSGDDDISGGSLPPGAVLGDPAADEIISNAGDLDHTNQRLRQREQDLLAEYERNAEALAAIGSGEGLFGRGEAADGAVVVEADADNRLTDLQLDPRALRLGSIENLRQAIMEAYEAALDDVADQVRDAGFGDLEPGTVRGMLDSIPELTRIVPESVWQRYLDPEPTPPPVDRSDPPPPRPRRARPPEDSGPDWQERNPYV